MIEIKKLSKSQKGYLLGIREKHNNAFQVEINQAINCVIEELGLAEDIKAGASVRFTSDYSTATITKARPETAEKSGPKLSIPGKLKK